MSTQSYECGTCGSVGFVIRAAGYTGWALFCTNGHPIIPTPEVEYVAPLGGRRQRSVDMDAPCFEVLGPSLMDGSMRCVLVGPHESHTATVPGKVQVWWESRRPAHPHEHTGTPHMGNAFVSHDGVPEHTHLRGRIEWLDR